MSKIQVLSEETINKIAAGEVIENPASVVKELVENAIDAGSTQITIEIRGGGLNLIRISDNGSGMGPEDAVLCLERHATSKIKNVTDLSLLFTMGFRGEALATIAAISKMTLMTSNGIGTKIECEGGKIVDVAPCARNQGTTIEVRSLFYNVPARKQFQKAPPLCMAEITRMMTHLSLAHPDVGFTLLKQDAEVFSLFPEIEDKILRRSQSILGSEYCTGSYKVDQPEISGILGALNTSRPNRSGQYLFINNRPIYSPLIALAVRDGYGMRLSEGRFPTFVLHLSILPELIDVNVHPQKREVRFKNESEIKQKVREAVQASFQPMSIEPKTFDFFPSKQETIDFSIQHYKMKEEPLQELPLPRVKEKALGVYDHFLLLDDLGKILVVDLIAAQASLFQDALKNKKVSKQGLLFPITFETSFEEAETIKLNVELLDEMGFSIRHLGGRSFIVDAIPPFFDEDRVPEIILAIMDDPSSFITTRFAGSSKKYFLLQEAVALYEETKKNPSLPQRQIVLHLTGDEIAKLFAKRI